jgi:hypothetical protein
VLLINLIAHPCHGILKHQILLQVNQVRKPLGCQTNPQLSSWIEDDKMGIGSGGMIPVSGVLATSHFVFSSLSKLPNGQQ